MKITHVIISAVLIGSLFGGTIFVLDGDIFGRDVVNEGSKLTLT